MQKVEIWDLGMLLSIVSFTQYLIGELVGISQGEILLLAVKCKV